MGDDVDSFSKLNSVKGFKVVHMNVRSLPKKVDQLRILLEGSQLDVLTLSETWLNESVNQTTLQFSDFVAYRQDREVGAGVKSRGGGLLTLINSKHAADCENLVDISKVCQDIEAQWLYLRRPHCRDVVICNVYRPPGGNLEKAIKYLDDSVRNFDLSKVELFLLGDLNVDYKNKTSPNYKKLSFFVQSNGLLQLIHNTTRNTSNSSSLLDLILTNSKYIKIAGTLNHFVSDHQPIYVVKKKKRDNRPKVEFTGRSYRNFDKDLFKEELSKCDWSDFYKLADPETAWDLVLDRFLPILDKMCPIRKFMIKNYRPEWITPELIEQIKDRDYFYKKAKQDGSEDSWNIAKHLRNTTNANIRQAKREFILGELDRCGTDSKKFWKVVKSVVPNNKCTNRTDIHLKDNTGEIIEKKNVAHYINSYFINIGKADLSVPYPDIESLSDAKGDHVEDQWSPDEFNVTEVLKVVKGINVSKSSGLQDISSYVIKEVFSILTRQIAHLMNLSLSSSIFPRAWKRAQVIPIPKSGNLTQVQNYRPISLLPLPGKILEKLMHGRLTDYIQANSLLSSNQHGFRKKHSTVHSVAQLTTFINKKMDVRLPTLAVFIDFRKAFDCVQHPILLNKLASLNICNEVLALFKSYLENREQKVLANNVFSSAQTITQGVPQGSVLGPLFYILYANDLVDVVKYCKVALYADDTVLYIANPDFDVSVRRMRKDVRALLKWCKNNGIRMNTDKTKAMVFGGQKQLKLLPEVKIKAEGTLLQVVPSYKYLGVTLDSQLNFAKHIGKIVRTASVKLRQFRRMRSFLDVNAATMVYKNMFLPVLEYGDIFLTSATAENRKRLQMLQNKGLRCALVKDKDTSTDDLHTEAKLLKLKYRREQHLLNFMYDMSEKESNIKKKCLEGVATRSSSKKLLKTKRPRTEKFKRSLSYYGPKKWNALPNDIQLAATRSEFKNKCQAYVEVKSRSRNSILL